MSAAPDPRDLIGPFVLGACTPEEEAEVRAHMAASAEFRAEVESYDGVREVLLDVPAPDVAPGADLKRSIMAQVQAEASLFAAAGPDERAAIVREAAAEDAATPGVEPPASAPERGTGAPTPSPRRNAFLAALRHPARATALAAVLVALIVGGVVLGSGGSDVEEFRGQPAPEVGATASVRLVARKDDSTLRLSGFPAAGAGKQYQVWLKSGEDAPRPTEVLFEVDGQGNAEATIPGDLSGVDDVLVTAEPEGGSQAPTSDPVLQVEI